MRLLQSAPRSRLNLVWMTLPAMLLFGCGQDPPKPVEPGNNDPDPPPAERNLAIVGSTLIQLESGSTTTLQVALAEEEVGPVANEIVEFEIVGQSFDSMLPTGSAATAITDSLGVASVDLTAGAQQDTFQVTASSAGTNTVAFAVQIVRLQQRIEIVRTPSVRVDSSGTRANVEATTSTRVQLRVRITDQFARPMSDLQVYYAFDQPARSASLDPAGSAVVTGSGGEAHVTLDTGDDTDDVFEVVAQTGESAAARWNVRLQADPSRVCTSDEECGPGLYCRNGICQGSAVCSNEDPVIECPPGFRCVVNECHPWVDIGCEYDTDCGPGFVCEDGSCELEEPQCQTNQDCPDGTWCHDGVCVVDPDGGLPNIAGGWYTAHHFDIRDRLPDVIDDVAGPLRTVHQILLVQIEWPSIVPDFIIDIVEGLVRDLIDAYVPEWVTTVVQILDTLATIMSDLRANGYMAVTQMGTDWQAHEVWDSFVFYYLPMCGGALPSDPTPECARVDLFVEDLTDHVSLGLNVHPFDGTVGEIDGGTAALLVNQRQVDMNIARLVRWVVDELVGVLTPHEDLEAAVLSSVDCEALGETAADLVGSWIEDIIDVSSLVESACDTAVGLALNRILDMLTDVAFDVGMLEIEGEATVNSISTGNYANLLGYPDYETGRDGRWDGRFTSVVGGVPGSWHASRRSLP